MKTLLMTILFSIILSSSISAEYNKPEEFPVVSYNILKTKEFNEKIYLATKNEEKWVYSAVLVALEYHKITDTSFVSIFIRNDRGEHPLTSTVTVTEYGYLDDSIRGKWLQFHLERESSESAWSVKEIRRAYLCGRMLSPKEFQRGLCP